MAEIVKVRNKSGESRYVPTLGIEVEADEVFDVPESLAAGLVSQSIWERVDGAKSTDAPAKKAAAK